jgi:hypothetical protein
MDQRINNARVERRRTISKDRKLWPKPICVEEMATRSNMMAVIKSRA